MMAFQESGQRSLGRDLGVGLVAYAAAYSRHGQADPAASALTRS